MPINYKILGQSNPAASTPTLLYTVPVSTQAVVSSIVVTNLASTTAVFNLSLQKAGASLTPSQYVAYGTSIPGNDSITYAIGITLGNTDTITVSANTSTVTFSAFGSEIS